MGCKYLSYSVRGLNAFFCSFHSGADYLNGVPASSRFDTSCSLLFDFRLKNCECVNPLATELKWLINLAKIGLFCLVMTKINEKVKKRHNPNGSLFLFTMGHMCPIRFLQILNVIGFYRPNGTYMSHFIWGRMGHICPMFVINVNTKRIS